MVLTRYPSGPGRASRHVCAEDSKGTCVKEDEDGKELISDGVGLYWTSVGLTETASDACVGKGMTIPVLDQEQQEVHRVVIWSKFSVKGADEGASDRGYRRALVREHGGTQALGLSKEAV